MELIFLFLVFTSLSRQLLAGFKRYPETVFFLHFSKYFSARVFNFLDFSDFGLFMANRFCLSLTVVLLAHFVASSGYEYENRFDRIKREVMERQRLVGNSFLGSFQNFFQT